MKNPVRNAPHGVFNISVDVAGGDEVNAGAQQIGDDDLTDVHGSGELHGVDLVHGFEDHALGDGAVGAHGAAADGTAGKLHRGGENAGGVEQLNLAVFNALFTGGAGDLVAVLG